eukprot:4152548-Pyramimonas_sp.AAC.1
MMQTGRLPPDFNVARGVFLPKDCPGGMDAAARAPACTRPLSLSNSDNKIVTSCVGFAVSEVVKDTAEVCRKGFVKGRQLVDNVFSLDAAFLKWAMMGVSPRIGSALCDVKN